MIARGWWPMQRWLAARPAITTALACAPIAAVAAAWRPPAELWPVAIACAVALLAPIVLARSDGSRRRQAGCATGAATVIAQPLIVAAVVTDVRLLIPMAATAVLAVVLPAVMPVRAPTAGLELTAEPELTHARWIVPLTALLAVGGVLHHHGRLTLGVPELDAPMLVTLAGTAVVWLGITLRPLVTLAVIAATLLALALTTATVSPMMLALALAIPLVTWFQRASAGGFPAWAPAVLAAAIAITLAADPAWPVFAMTTALTWFAIAIYPPRAAGAAERGTIAWTQRAFGGLEPYWRFYARGKLTHDPIYERLAGDARAFGSVLDAGCGPGLTAMLAAGRADTTAYLGVDLDLDKLLVARRALGLRGRALCPSWRLRCDQFPLAQLPAERFDTILVLDVLHYWPVDQQATTLAQLATLLQPGGRLYLREGVAGVDGDAGQIERGERFTTYFGLNPETAMTFLPASRIATLITSAGLAIESDEPMGSENRLWVCRFSG